MSDHYIALNRGIEGFKQTDFITGTASTAGTNKIEVRIADGAGLTKKDAVNALRAFERFIETAPWVAAEFGDFAGAALKGAAAIASLTFAPELAPVTMGLDGLSAVH